MTSIDLVLLSAAVVLAAATLQRYRLKTRAARRVR